MVYNNLIKFGGNRKQIRELLEIAEEKFNATIYAVPDNLKDEVEEKTNSLAYRGSYLAVVEYPSLKEHKGFVEFSGEFRSTHKGISNFVFLPISNKALIRKIKKVK